MELFINQVSTQFPRSKKLVHLHSQTLKFQHLGKLHFMKDSLNMIKPYSRNGKKNNEIKDSDNFTIVFFC
jgi:hypothetical protein